MRTLQTEFTFAGFTWPRYVADMACGPRELRAKRQQRTVTGGYYHAPRPNANDGKGFYLDDAGQPAPRWFATGTSYSYSPEGDNIQGLVLQLPHGRFLAGWTMGRHMASAVGSRVFNDIDEAKAAANDEAQRAAAREADFHATEETDEA